MNVSKKRILLVEDNFLVQKTISFKLEKFGFGVDIAKTGEEALSNFEQCHYDFIFLDLGLPDIDGYTVAKKIRAVEKQRDSRRTPIVALTAHIGDTFRKRALEAGMDDFISKPLTKEHIEYVITHYGE